MLSRTAAHLYWIGRYMERAEFATRLIEATIRLAALGAHEESEQAWRSALSVVGAASSFRATGETHNPANVRRYLTLAETNSSSVRTCLAQARDNARAARTALTVEVWEAINRAWLIIRDRTKPGGVQQSLNLMDSLKAEIRGFEGALTRMLLVHAARRRDRARRQHRAPARRQILPPPPARPGGGRRARPRPMVNFAPDRLRQDRLPPYLFGPAQALARGRFPDLPRRDATFARRLGRGDCGPALRLRQ